MIIITKPKMINPFVIEWICLREFDYFIRRNRRYFITFVAIYLYSIFSWNRLRLLRAGHCLTQHIDDVLDDDRIVDFAPLDYIDDLMRQVELHDYHLKTPISILACYVFTEADARYKGDNDLRGELLELFKTLRKDRERFEAKRPLLRAEVDNQHRRTFVHSISASLMMVDSKIRAADTPEMVGALSWASPMRDLQDDLQRGLINIPLEVIEQAESEGLHTLIYDELIATSAVKTWIKQEFKTGWEHLMNMPKRLRTLGFQRGTVEIWAFYMEIKRYARRYAKTDPVISGEK